MARPPARNTFLAHTLLRAVCPPPPWAEIIGLSWYDPDTGQASPPDFPEAPGGGVAAVARSFTVSRQTLYRALEALHNRGCRWGLNPSASSSKRTVSWVGLRKPKALPQRCSSQQLMLWWGREGGLPAYVW